MLQLVNPPVVPPPPPPPPPAAVPLIVTGSDNGAVVCLFSPDARFHGGVSFGSAFTGVRPAAGDFTGDGVPDVLVGSGPGDPSRVG